MSRADAAKKKLADMHEPVPTPTPEAIAQNKAEQQSRGHETKRQEAMSFLHHHPDTSAAAHVGDPVMVDAQQTSAVELVRNANATLMGTPPGKTGSGISIETNTSGAPPENQPVPRSDSGATAPETAAPVENGAPTPTAPSTSGGASSNTAITAAPAAVPAATPADATSAAPAPAPARVNDAATDSSSSGGSQTNAQGTSSTSSTTTADPSKDSTSKKKKKKGLAKLNPF
jgi:outer membrane protein assembly factor BamD